MYYEVLLRMGLVLLAGRMLGGAHWLLLIWLMVAIALFLVQRDAPYRFREPDAQHVFVHAVAAHTGLAVVMAMLTQSTGMLLIAIGAVLNLIAVWANDNRMPIMGVECPNSCFVDIDERTRLPWLCDIFPLTPRRARSHVISGGDALECIGMWVLLAELVLGR